MSDRAYAEDSRGDRWEILDDVSDPGYVCARHGTNRGFGVTRLHTSQLQPLNNAARELLDAAKVEQELSGTPMFDADALLAEAGKTYIDFMVKLKP